MSSMMLIMMAVVLATGLGLIGLGAWYQLHRDRLESDSILIRSCYLFGGALLAGNLVIPALA